MNKLDYKDELQMTTYEGIQETQILSDYLSELERLVVEFEQDRTQDNMIALAYEATRSVDHLVYLNNHVLYKLIQIEELARIDVDVEEA